MSQPESDPPKDEPVENELERRSWAERPLNRGILNGIVFTMLLMGSQVYGLFQPARSLTQDDVARHVLVGVLFGFAMYVYTMWRERRRARARAAQAEPERKEPEE